MSSFAVYLGLPPSPGIVRQRARIPPVDVPAMRSNVSAIGLPVRSSISASTIAGIIPRRPPPSMESTLNTSAMNRSFPGKGALYRATYDDKQCCAPAPPYLLPAGERSRRRCLRAAETIQSPSPRSPTARLRVGGGRGRRLLAPQTGWRPDEPDEER